MNEENMNGSVSTSASSSLGRGPIPTTPPVLTAVQELHDQISILDKVLGHLHSKLVPLINQTKTDVASKDPEIKNDHPTPMINSINSARNKVTSLRIAVDKLVNSIDL